MGGAAVGAKVGVLALQGAARPHLAALADLGAHAVAVRRPSELDAVDALVIPGGESTTISFLLDESGLRRPIKERLSEGMPALGTCAGMILLAREVLDGRSDQRSLDAIDITVRRNAFGRQVDSFEADLDVGSLPGGPFPAVFIRAPGVTRVGESVEVLATVERPGGGEPVPALCRSGPIMVSSFHPELSGDLRLHNLFLEEV